MSLHSDIRQSCIVNSITPARVQCLKRHIYAIRAACSNYEKLYGYGLASGWAGLALLEGYAHRWEGHLNHSDSACLYLEKAVECLAAFPNAGLFSGYSGVAWTIDHLSGWALDTEGLDPNKEVDEMILDLLAPSPWRADIDLVSGLTGFGVYALERMPSVPAKNILRRILEHLEVLAQPCGLGIAWLSPPEVLSPWQRESAPNGHFNMGTAHGLPGVIGLLSALVTWGLFPDRGSKLLEGAMACLQSQIQDEASRGLLGSWTSPGQSRPSNAYERTAWCYGDLGASLPVLMAAHTLGRKDWKEFALRLARAALHRQVAQPWMKDACLCHGAAGNAQAFLRLYLATGDPSFAAQAMAYLDATLGFHAQGGTCAGWWTYSPVDENDLEPMKAQPGLLEGAVGVGLAFLSFLSPLEPSWDRFLLHSFRRP